MAADHPEATDLLPELPEELAAYHAHFAPSFQRGAQRQWTAV